MNLFEHTYSKDILAAYINGQKQIGNQITYQSIADNLRMQKSYLSKITSGNAYFTKDQIYMLSQIMKLDSEQTEYLFLVSDYERASLVDYKNDLEKKVKKIQLANTQSEAYLKKNVTQISDEKIHLYYLYPEIQLVHLSFGISKYQRKPSLLKDVFQLSDQLYNEILKILSDLKLIELKKDRVSLLRSNMHLPKDSPYFHQWQLQFKLKSLEWLKKLNDEDKYNFVVSFTSCDEDKEKIRLEFMKFLKKVENIVKKSDSKDIYQLSFDLFKWN